MPKKVTKGNDSWETPQALFDGLNKQYRFAFDCCASTTNHKTTLFFSTEEHYVNFLTYDRLKAALESSLGPCFMNPPFSQAKEMFQHFIDIGVRGVCIFRSDNLESKVWQDVILPNCSWVFFPKGRIQYEGYEGASCMFPSALIGFGVPPPVGLDGHILLKARW